MTEPIQGRTERAEPGSVDSGPPLAGPGRVPGDPGGIRRTAARALSPLLMLYLTLGVVQIFLAGQGVFSLDGQELGADDETAFDPHRFVALLMSVVALLVVVAAGVARPGRRIVIMSVVLFLMVFVVQTVLAAAGEDIALFGGLHAILGIASLGLAGSLHARARDRGGRGQQRAEAEVRLSA